MNKNKDNRANESAAKPDISPKAVDCMYYSKVLKEPFNTIAELSEAEEAYYAKLKNKEEKAIQKKADAQKVEEAFKVLNAARKAYKEDTVALTKEYAAALDTLKKSFELGQKDIKEKLANAEESYSKALKDFTSKYDQFHLTLKDGDFETTLSSKKSAASNPEVNLSSLWDFFFNF